MHPVLHTSLCNSWGDTAVGPHKLASLSELLCSTAVMLTYANQCHALVCGDGYVLSLLQLEQQAGALPLLNTRLTPASWVL